MQTFVCECLVKQAYINQATYIKEAAITDKCVGLFETRISPRDVWGGSEYSNRISGANFCNYWVYLA